MRKQILILIISAKLLMILPANSQDILMEETVITDTTIPDSGPNMKNYNHTFIGISFALGPDSLGSNINYGKSFAFSFGYRYKAKINNFYALGIDLQYQLNSFSLKQDSTKLVPNDSLHDKEKVKFHNLSLGFYNRFNYGKRGNYIGNFVDIGMKIELPFLVAHITKDELKEANENNGKAIKTRTTKLDYIEPYHYSAYTRIGFNRYVLSASYRLSRLFTSDPKHYSQYNNGINKYPELPVLSIGLEIGIY